jgi:hypothetical protein
MNASSWDACHDAPRMLGFLQGKVSDRKLRLFACAACRRLWSYVVDPRSRQAVEMSEQFADGQVTLAELQSAWQVANQVADDMANRGLRGWNLARTVAAAANDDASVGALRAAQSATDADLVREIFAPFGPKFDQHLLPASVIRLAEAAYAGERCNFALHDALLEAGLPALAEHFQTSRHYKGCWAVDLILAKHP